MKLILFSKNMFAKLKFTIWDTSLPQTFFNKNFFLSLFQSKQNHIYSVVHPPPTHPQSS